MTTETKSRQRAQDGRGGAAPAGSKSSAGPSWRAPRLQNLPLRTEIGRALRQIMTGSTAIHVDYAGLELRLVADLVRGGGR